MRGTVSSTGEFYENHHSEQAHLFVLACHFEEPSAAPRCGQPVAARFSPPKAGRRASGIIVLALESANRAKPAMSLKPTLSVVVVGYNMARELPRTIRSLSLPLQRDIDLNDYEIIVIDNGSSPPLDPDTCTRWGENITFRTMPQPTQSPVPALNWGLELASGDLIGTIVDGARMASPGLLARAIEASRLHERPVIGTLGFHLGFDLQSRSMMEGYDQRREDELLDRSGWEDDGYRLFSIAVFGGACLGGWFEPVLESNALFLTQSHWRELGGYDPRFISRGGGLCCPDIWRRACESANSRVIMLLGEATFHQIHGGVFTNSAAPPIAEFVAEYRRMHGADFALPKVTPLFFGSLCREVLPSIARSVAPTLASAGVA